MKKPAARTLPPVTTEAASHSRNPTPAGSGRVGLLKVVGAPTAARAPFRALRASELVARHLRNRIIRGQLKEGERLPQEAELVAAFQVSRPTMREAIGILEAEGLVVMKRGAKGGVIVHRPDVRVAARYVEFILESTKVPVTDVFFVRAVIEPAAARVLAEEKRDTAPAILRECIAEGREKFDSDFQFGIAAARLHNKLVELTEKPTLILLSNLVLGVYERYLSVVAENAARNVDNSPAKSKGLKALEKLIEHIENGDSEGAERFWREHMLINGKVIRKWLPADGVVDLLDS